MTAVEAIMLQDKIINEVLRKTYDPEIPVDIYELGLIYETKVDPETGSVYVKMTLTAPGCPAAGTLPGEVEDKIRRLAVSEIKDIKVDVVWDPPWDPTKMSEAARLQLGMF
ncbi:MAG: iron-sulfur cluster assembly protein [Terriglobia bacterium]